MSDLGEYYHFDVEKFLKAIPRLKNEKKRLERELESVSYISAVQTDKPSVSSSGISDSTADIAIRLAELHNRINSIDIMLDKWDEVSSRLSFEEFEIIKGFFFGDTSIGSFVDTYCYEHGVSKNTLYRLRACILYKLADMFQ